MEVNGWVTLPGKLPRSAEVLAEGEGNLEWIEKEGDEAWHVASRLPAARVINLTLVGFPRERN